MMFSRRGVLLVAMATGYGPQGSWGRDPTYVMVDAFNEIAISRDGSMFVVNPMINGGRELLLWRADGGGRILSFPGAATIVTHPMFSPDGSRLLVIVKHGDSMFHSTIHEIDLTAAQSRVIGIPFDYAEAPFYTAAGGVGFFTRLGGEDSLTGRILDLSTAGLTPIDDRYRFVFVRKARPLGSRFAVDGIRGANAFEANALDDSHDSTRAHILGGDTGEIDIHLARAAKALRPLRMFGVTDDGTIVAGGLSTGSVVGVGEAGVVDLLAAPGLSAADVGATTAQILVCTLDSREPDWQRSKRFSVNRESFVLIADIYNQVPTVEIR